MIKLEQKVKLLKENNKCKKNVQNIDVKLKSININKLYAKKVYPKDSKVF